MKKLLLALLILICFTSYSQTTGYFRYDTVRLEKFGGNTSLIIRNATRDTLGFLYNYGDGRTRFDRIRAVPGGIKVGDDTILINSGGFFSPDQTSLGPTVHDGGRFPFLLNMVESFYVRAPDAIDAGSGTIRIDSITAIMQAVRDVNHRAGFQAFKDGDEKWMTKIDASDSVQIQYPDRVVSIADSAQWYMMVQRKNASGTLGKAFWPVGGGSGVDSTAYSSMRYIDDSTVAFVRLNGTEDTLVYSAGAGGSGVSNFIDLADGPGAFTGQSLKSIRVNAGETALEYFTIPTAGDVTKVGTPVNNYLGVWTGDGTIEGDIDLQFNGTQLGIQGVPGYALDVWNGSAGSSWVGGADQNLSTRTNSTNKFFGIAMAHYTNSQPPWTMIRGASGSAANTLVLGGGSSTPGATQVEIYTGATVTTTTFSKRMDFINTGGRINSDLNDYDFSIGGDTDASLFKTDAGLDVVAIGGAAVSGNKLSLYGHLNMVTAGNKIKIATGSNASIGVSGAMTAGTITISTTAVTASSIIMLTNAAPGGGAVGVLSVGTITAGTSFIINSSSGTDTSTVNWWIIN